MRLPFTQRTRSAVLCLSLLTTSLATAGSITFTFMPESSPPYPSGTYGSNSDDPLGPTGGLTVSYLGFGNGGSSEFLPRLFPADRDAFLVYRFRLNFDGPVVIDSIVMTGWGDNRPGPSQMRLLDSSMLVLSTEPLTGINQPSTWVLSGNGATGTTFFYDEFDGSGVVRVRDNLTVNYESVPEPSQAILTALTLAGLCAVSLWQRSPFE
jgi:hypothetical protein